MIPALIILVVVAAAIALGLVYATRGSTRDHSRRGYSSTAADASHYDSDPGPSDSGGGDGGGGGGGGGD